jgi:hypothetical protein
MEAREGKREEAWEYMQFMGRVIVLVPAGERWADGGTRMIQRGKR